MICIENVHKIGDTVFLKTDVDSSPRLVVGIIVRSHGLMYELIAGTETSYHYDFEISKEHIVQFIGNET